VSTDPIIAEYLPHGKDVYFPEKKFDANKLKGAGGFYKSININLYQYAGLNPIKNIDPDGCKWEASNLRYAPPYQVEYKGKTYQLEITYKNKAQIVTSYSINGEMKAEVAEQKIHIDKSGAVYYKVYLDGEVVGDQEFTVFWGMHTMEGMVKRAVDFAEMGLGDELSTIQKMLIDQTKEEKLRDRDEYHDKMKKEINSEDTLEDFIKRDMQNPRRLPDDATVEQPKEEMN